MSIKYTYFKNVVCKKECKEFHDNIFVTVLKLYFENIALDRNILKLISSYCFSQFWLQ